jgi:hypothetical protein
MKKKICRYCGRRIAMFTNKGRRTDMWRNYKPRCTRSRHRFVTSQCGCTENPGVFDQGNGSLAYYSECVHCGLRRKKVKFYATGRGSDYTVYSESMEDR